MRHAANVDSSAAEGFKRRSLVNMDTVLLYLQLLTDVPGTGPVTTAAIEQGVPPAFFRISAKIPLQR